MRMLKLLSRFLIVIVTFLGTVSAAVSGKTDYNSSWEQLLDGHFVGSEIWSNPLQDWRVKDGALECFVPGGERNIYLLTHEVQERPTKFEMSVTLNRLSASTLSQGILGSIQSTGRSGYVGFRFGVKGKYDDYRDRAFHGQGTKAGVGLDGALFIGNTKGERIPLGDGAVQLKLIAEPDGEAHRATLTALDANGIQLGQVVRHGMPAATLAGGLGLTCHSGKPNSRELVGDYTDKRFPKRVQDREFGFWRQAAQFGFRDWSVSGDALIQNPDRAFGPIAFALYSVDRGTLKLTAQMMPVSPAAGDTIALEIKKPGTDDFEEFQIAEIDQTSHTAHFRIENWETKNAVAYRLTYEMAGRQGVISKHTYSGSFNSEPLAGEQMTVASLSCQYDLGYPHQGLLDNVLGFDPDLVIFSGDQIYEWNAGYGLQTAPFDAARLDYLRKWYQFGWAFRDLFRDRPSILIIDDHDVFQGNVWGGGGRPNGGNAETMGGYSMSAEWVNMVQKTQTSHLPDPYDPTPVQQGIGVYYTDLLYGGVSFALIEDRKWKSGPGEFFSPFWIKMRSFLGRKFDFRTDTDVAGAELLGRRQIEFLDEWSADWSGDARMKAVVSSTLFTSVHTYPRMPPHIYEGVWAPPVDKGEYPEGDVIAKDFDTNGWPQSPRRLALETMRKGFALHIAGDAHFGTVQQYGIEDWNDAAWVAGSPAISSIITRRWFPSQLPLDYEEGTPRNHGKFRDGFGNPVTIHAVANPTVLKIQPYRINDFAPGYNILAFDTGRQEVEIQAWPRHVDPHAPDSQQFEGWPVTVKHTDNGYPYDGLALPKLDKLPTQNPVIQVVDHATNEIIYTVRQNGRTVVPRVFEPGIYDVRVFDEQMNLLVEYGSLTAEAVQK